MVPILIIPKDPFSFNPPDHEMMKGAGHVYAGFSGHENLLSKINPFSKLYFYGHPLFRVEIKSTSTFTEDFVRGHEHSCTVFGAM